MIIEQINNDKIKVVVDKNEQREYGITYASMNYSDQNTRKLCEKIIKTANRQVGFYVGNAKLLVEAHRGNNGTVTIYLSRIPLETENGEEFLYQTVKFENADNLFDGCRLFEPITHKLERSKLFYYKNSYYLYFEIISDMTFARRFLENLLEYGERTAIDPLFIAEHGEIIENKHAIEKIILKH